MGGMTLWSAFTQPDTERIQPTYRNGVDAYKSSGVVAGVMSARINLFTEAQFKFQNKQTLALYGTPALDRLENPWPNGTSGELLARMEQDGSLAGNAFIRDVNPGLLERLRPDWVTIVSAVVEDPYYDTEVRQLLGYWYQPPPNENREPEFYPVEQVAHWTPIPDPDRQFCGLSWLSSVLREVDADVQMTEYKRAFLTNAATPNLLVRYSGKIGDAKAKDVGRQIAARHGGVGNAFKTLVLDEGADVTVVGQSFEQMAFTAVKAAGENAIAVAAQVPAVVAGLKEGLDSANYAVYDAAMRKFADGTMRPLWRSACAALEKLVAVPEDSRLWFNESGIAALRQGEKEQADTMLTLAEAAQALIVAGYVSDSVTAALTAGDLTLLVHSGLMSVQMQTPGSSPTPGGAA